MIRLFCETRRKIQLIGLRPSHDSCRTGARSSSPIVKCLAHEHSVLRSKAIMALVGLWRMERYVPHADRILVEDPDELVRGNAAWALSMYAARADRISEQERRRILRTLARVVQADEDPGVQQSAYEGVLRILDRPSAEYMHEARLFDPRHDVNWELLKPYLK